MAPDAAWATVAELPATSAPVSGLNALTVPLRKMPPNQPVLSRPAPSTYVQLLLPGVPSGQPDRLSGDLGVSPWIESTTLSPIFRPAQLGSSAAMRSAMKPSKILPSVVTVELREAMLANAPCGSSFIAG